MAWRVIITKIWLNVSGELAAHWSAEDQSGRVETGGWFNMQVPLALCVGNVLGSRGLSTENITCDGFDWRRQVAGNNDALMRRFGAIRVKSVDEMWEHHGKRSGLLWLWNEHPSNLCKQGKAWSGPMPMRDVEDMLGFKVVVYSKDKPDFDIV